MDKQSKKSGLGALITGTILSGALFGASSLNAAEMFSYNDLGSGAELRSELLNASNSGMKAFEATCGEKKAEGDSKAAEHKCGEGKCGEGKCGEKKAEGDTKAAGKSDESKAAEHKCGEGKCGGEHGDAKKETKAKSDKK